MYHHQEVRNLIKHLTAHGHSAALILDKPILDLLNINRHTPLEVSTDGKSLIISPVANASRAKRFRTTLDHVNARHEKTLTKLAE